jgi:triosephosphate isomerase
MAKIVIGNWKLNMTLEKIKAFETKFDPSSNAIIAASFLHLPILAEKWKGHGIKLAAQDCSQEAEGAFTGEVSAKMLKELNINHVILGHSERRLLFGDSNEVVFRKVKAAYDAGLEPIICIGESSQDRAEGKTLKVLQDQLTDLLPLIKDHALKTTVAYEPIWAIGTGKAATVEDAKTTHQSIRDLLTDKLGTLNAKAIAILYGGSLTDKNAEQLFACPQIDGGLVGGASLNPEIFAKIISLAS